MSTVMIPVYRRTALVKRTPVSLYAVPHLVMAKPNIEEQPTEVFFKNVAMAVGAVLRVPIERLIGNRKTADIARGRMYIMYIMRKHSNITQLDLGHRLGRDHTTIIYGVKTIQHRIVHEPAIAKEYTAICLRLSLPADL